MAGKVQRWCVSHTVKGTATIRVTDGVANADTTIPEGVYWSDPVYGSLMTSVAPSLYGKFAYLLDANATAVCALTEASLGSVFYNFRTAKYTVTGGLGDWWVSAAGCTTEGLRLLKPLCLRPMNDTSVLLDGEIISYTEGCWRANQGEYGSEQEQAENMGATTRSFSGYGYGFRIGEPLRRRLIRFSGLPHAFTWNTSITVYNQSQFDYSFQSNVWNYLARGEMVRVYDDESATHTYLSAALTATATSVSVASGSGISNSTKIWIDGEPVIVTSGGGTTTLKVERPFPVAHSIYAPVSTDRVATYVLDNDGGNANMGEFTAERRAYNQTRYDLDVPLLRTTF